MRVLILAGTAEARALAALLAGEPGLAVTAALAGRTEAPATHAVPVRRGGFGGAAGLAAHLRAERVEILVDATHPFAARMGAQAAEAAAATGCALLRLERPGWRPGPGDRWQTVPDLAAAAAALPGGAHAFLATGPGGLAPFLERRDLALTLRAVAPPEPMPPHPALGVVTGLPPDDPEAEAALFRRLGVTHLVAKNAGGPAAAKLAAARALALPVVMVARPSRPAVADTVATPEAAAERIRALAAGRAGVAPP